MTPTGNPRTLSERARRQRALQQTSDWEPLIVQAGPSVHALAELFGVSLRCLQRYVKATYGRTLSALLETVRLQNARAMLASGCPVKVVALSFGYKQVSHFSRNFRNQFGSCPSKFVIRACLGDQAASLPTAAIGEKAGK
jgi:transcriptional regulator GlxA family with amidase domain